LSMLPEAMDPPDADASGADVVTLSIAPDASGLDNAVAAGAETVTLDKLPVPVPLTAPLVDCISRTPPPLCSVKKPPPLCRRNLDIYDQAPIFVRLVVPSLVTLRNEPIDKLAADAVCRVTLGIIVPAASIAK